ncbi:MAG: hypothetical protein M8844_08660 [marine benthic group bacterium]|nr:hypothetical protein [Gemmatimonadota bacterium]
MKASEHRRERYEIVARLGEVERRIDDVHREWERFRERPSPERLAGLRRSVTATGRSLNRLADRLNRGPEEPRSEATRRRDSPNPRDLVAAGRDLDAFIEKAQLAWSGSRGAPDAASLMEISETLAGAERAAVTLGEALRELDENALRSRRPDSRANPATVSTLEQLLEEVREVWTALRREPTLAGTLRLRGTLRSAREQARILADLAGSTSSLSDPEALSYLGGAADSVRFPPYMDRESGTYNGHGFEVSAKAEISRCVRYERPFGLLLLSVVRDDPGSVRAVIGAIRGLLRASDLLGRVSETELVLGLPESDGRATRRIAARILRALDAAEHGSTVRGLSYSVLPADGRHLDELLERARGRLHGPDADLRES